ncbi:MAG: sigma-70 family RNA polymerase sigma factor [Planctomycetes bacterium]|nr:sigma-70 family RNA polymerase sigma factor [Planctomycetota bacterium]
MSDESGYMQFLAEARAGGQAGMGRLAVLVWERLFPFVLRAIRNRDAAEDILQETLLTMLRRLDSLRDGRRFWPWIYRIAWSKVQDRRRDRHRRGLQVTALRRRAQAGDLLSGPNDPLEAQVRAETLQQIAVAVARLNCRQRDILQLRCCEDLPYAEIAARTCTSPEKVRIRFHRAKESVKAQLVGCP